MKFFSLLNIFLISSMLLFISCKPSVSDENSLVVGTSADNPPFEFIQDGKITGLDIELAEELAKTMNKKLIIKNLDFSGLFPALMSDNIDIIIAGLSNTPERAENIDFSSNYVSTSMVIMYNSIDLDIKIIEDIKDKILGSQLGTTYEQLAKSLANKYNCSIHSLANNLMLVEELKSKVIHAMILEESQGNRFIALNPSFKIFKLDEESQFAVGMTKNSELKAEINSVLKQMTENNFLKSLKLKWLN